MRSNHSRQPSSCQLCNPRRHGKESISHSLDTVSVHIDHIKRNKEQRHAFHINIHQTHDLIQILRHKQSGQHIAKEEHQHSEHDRIHAAHDRCCPEAPADPLHLTRTHILCTVSSHRSTQCHINLCYHLFDLICRSKRCHMHRTKHIQCSLHHHRTDRSDRILQCHRKTDGQLLPYQMTIQFKIPAVQLQNRHFLNNIDQAKQRRNSLRNNCRIRRSRCSQVKHNDQYQIQHNIQCCRKQQKIQRCLTVPQRTQDTR